MKSWILVTLPLALFACGVAENKVRARAAFDLQCKESELQLTEIDSQRMYGATGCGRQGTYIFRDGQPILNSPVSAVATSAPPQSTPAK